MWEFNLKDALYIICQLVVFIGFIYTMNYKIRKLEERSEFVKKVLFQEKGGLNIIDNATCKAYRDQVHTAIRKEAQINRRAFDHIDIINQNIIQIMMHMKLKPIVLEHNYPSEE